jgi:RNA polymerase sigma factor (sigma-70 family)
MEPFRVRATLHSVTPSPNDEAEWADALLGDGEAFGRIFDRHYSRVFRHSYRLVSIPADVDDLVSMVFLEAWRKRHSLRFVEGSLLPWLLVTATNLSRNLARNGRRYREVLSQLPVDLHEDDAPPEGGDGHDALRQLSPNDQRVIVLCVLEGFSERDAAFVLGIPSGTVKSRLSRAKARLAGHVTAARSQRLSMEARNEL